MTTEQDADYGPLDYFQSMVWYLMLGVYVYFFGWIFGIVFYAVSYQVLAPVMKAVFNLEMMSGGDEIFFQEDARNCLNIVAFNRYAKFDADAMGQAMVSRACAFPRLKSKVVKFLGRYMFEEQSDKYMMDSIPTNCKKVTGIHTEKELADFMAKEQSTRLPLGGLQWRLFFIEDFNKDESIFIIKVHHSLADGIAIILMNIHLTDKPRLEDYP